MTIVAFKTLRFRYCLSKLKIYNSKQSIKTAS